MDDILTAALGQSGIDLSFLDETTSTSPSNVAPQGSNRVNSACDNDDLADFLNLLDQKSPQKDVRVSKDSQVKLSTAANITHQLNKPQPQPRCEPPRAQINSQLTFPRKTNPTNNFVISPGTRITLKKGANFQNTTLNSQSMRPILNRIVLSQPRSPLSQNLPIPVAANTKVSSHSLVTTANNQSKGRMEANQTSNIVKNVEVKTSFNTSNLLNGVNSNGQTNASNSNSSPTDAEKTKRSIQHMLCAGNLTSKEKSFLLKSAIAQAASNSIKPQSPSLSSHISTPSGLSSLSRSSISSKEEDEEEDEEENLVHSETFAEYMPTKSRIGQRHPDPVVETSSMASVSPPDIWYNLRLPSDVIERNVLSALQLEAIIYACQQHEKLLPNGKRAGFLIGDGAGVGKGRTVAGMIYENYLLGRKRGIWLSVSNDLHYDAVRDLRDIGCHVKVHPLNKFKYDEKITSKANGKFKKGIIFSTYSALIGETSGKARFQTRLDQLLHWCGKDFDGVIILDECHKAKNLMPAGSSKPTKTGITVLKLQDQLPKARVVYCSATGASEPKNMAYMNRLGLWGLGTPFREFNDFIQSIEKRGVGAMEMVAMDMKLRGMYMARQLSFAGVTFDVKEVGLCPSFIEMYDASVKLWLDAREKFEKAADIVGLESRCKKTMWGQFWSAHQRFFKYLCIACKVKRAVDIAKESVRSGKCIIFGLQSTGEARTLDQLDDMGGDLNDFISTTKGVFSTLVEKHFPGSERVDEDTEEDKEFAENNAMFLNGGHKKRKREWRKNINRGTKRQRVHKTEDGVEFMSSSESDSETEDGKNTDLSTTLGSDEDGDSDSDDNTSNVFKDDSSSGSDDEESWLKSINSDKRSSGKIKKPEKKAPVSKNAPSYVDPSMNVLAAAGFNMGKQYSWANAAATTNQVSTANMRSHRVDKVTAPSGLSKQLASLSSADMSNLSKLEQVREMKYSLLEKLDVIAQYLPPNTLDELIDELGGTDFVAEMTGRKGRVVNKEDGSYVYEPRSKDDVPLELLNIAEKKRFMEGEKLVAVISEAASSGVSLQADRRVKNQRRRVHITLELPWSADKAIQQFGRSHRSNQVSAPEYIFLISELAGEQRFASIVAKRLESLGALTHGDRRATESRDLSRYNFDTKYGRQALDIVLKSIIGLEKPVTPVPKDYPGNFLEDVRVGLVGAGLISKDVHTGSMSVSDKDYTNISRFMNRILGLTVALQNTLFQYFTATLASIIKDAKRSGRWDEGIVDLGQQGESVQQVDRKTFLCPSTCGQVTTELATVVVERGLSFKRAKEMQETSTDTREGFYLSSQLRNGKKTVVLILRAGGPKQGLFSIYRPNIGLIARPEEWNDICKKYEKVDPDRAKSNWKEQYEYSANNCVHAFWRGFCKRKLVGLACEVGTRKRTCHLLCGSVLSVWSKVENVLACQPGANSKMQIIRVRLDSGLKLVGTLIPNNCVELLCKTLNGDDTVEFR